jgi:eukaryotic-like serine/threonine-protein kinase
LKQTEASRCPECGVPLPEYWPKGFCPKCALDGALQEPSEEVVSEGGSAPFSPHRFGDYELFEERARGGMGVVYRARQLKLNRIVALKMILAGQFASKEEVLRFRGEAEAAARLQHPNIVSIHETGERDGHHYFSMDYVEGRTLADIVRDGPLPAQRAAKYACRIAEAIHYAHSQGVLHRDLKPSNVIIDAHDEPQITDFGLAKRMRDDFGVTVTGQVLGSPNFMPPEQTSAKSGRVGPASDVYGVGAILYCLLTGRPPFHAETIEELLLQLRDTEPVSPRLLNPSVPRDLETISLKCLEKDPARRYATAEALADELGRFIRDEPIQARPLRLTGKLWRWCRRRPAIAALSSSVVLLLLAVAVSSNVAAWRVNRARLSEQKANRNLRQTVSLLELERAEDFFNANDAAFGVAHLSAMVRRDPSNSIAANRLVSAITQRPWALPVSVPLRHLGRVTTAVFSPDGERVLTGSWDKSAHVWNARSSESIFALSHNGQISSASYSLDGKRILTASLDGTVQISDALTGDALKFLPHSKGVYWAEFSRDGTQVVTASADRAARIWNAASGALKHELRGHGSHVVLARFTPDGKRVFTGGSAGSVRGWDAESGQALFHLEDRKRTLTALAISPDGKRLACACEDGIVKLWSASNGQSLGAPLIHRRGVSHATFSPDSSLLLTTCEDGGARLWNSDTLQQIGEPLRHESGVSYGGFSPDGEKIVTTSSDNTARVWGTRNRTPLCQALRHIERVLHAGFSADGRRLVTASYDGQAQVWDLRPGLEPSVQIRHGRNVSPLALTPDGQAALTAAHDRTARLWDVRTGQPLSEPVMQDSFATRGDFAADGHRVVLAYIDGSIRLWDWGQWKMGSRVLAQPRLIAGPIQHGSKINSVRFSRDGARFVTASAGKTARIWNATNGQPVGTPLVHNDEVMSADFSGDGSKAVTASFDRSARVWDAATGRPLSEPLIHIDHVKWVGFSPDGTQVVTASTDNSACLWDAATGKKLITLPHARIVDHASFSADGTLIATACLDRTARIWDARTGQALTPPLWHEGPVARVYFSANARRLFTTMWGEGARVWDADTGRPLTEWLNTDAVWGEQFEPLSGRVLLGSKEGLLRIWDLPEAPMPVPEWFLKFAEAVAGIRLGTFGNAELVSSHELGQLSTEFLASPGKANFYQDIVSRFFRLSPSPAAVK